MSVFSGFVTIWVKLPSSAPTLWFGVLSLVNWAARLHCLLPSAPMYCQSTFDLLWAELFLDLLLCRRVTVAGLHCQVLPMYCQSTFNLLWAELFLDLLLCRRVTVADLHCQVLPMYCQSTFFLWAELFLDLLLCRRVTVRQLHCQSATNVLSEYFPSLG